jgi:hypothetical protein
MKFDVKIAEVLIITFANYVYVRVPEVNCAFSNGRLILVIVIRLAF